MSKHTPGPWTVVRDRLGGWSVYCGDNLVCCIGDQEADEQLANAILISKAPELVEMVRRLTDKLYQCPEVGQVYDEGHQRDHMSGIVDARALLAEIDGDERTEGET